MKLHIRDIRLRNNAGIDMPVCKASAELLDMDATRYPTTGDRKQATCKHCIRQYAHRYAWAVR